MRWPDRWTRTVLATLRGHPLLTGGVVAAVAILVLGFLAVRSVLGPAPASDFGPRVPGQRIYDQTGLLSTSQVAVLDRRAIAIERAGIPVVVYIRNPVTDEDDTQTAARELMRSWAVESRPGAGDGLVLLLDVDQSALVPDRVALVAGDELGQSRLPAQEAERIATDTIAQPLGVAGSSEGLVDSLRSSLAATERRLLLGAPVAPGPSLAERLVTTAVRVPLAVLSLLLSLATLISVAMLWSARPRPARSRIESDPVPEALRVALGDNRVSAAVVAVAIRDLVRVGAVTFEDAASDDADDPDGAPRGALRLRDHSRVAGRLGQAIWADLAAVADPDGRVAARDVGLVARHPRRLTATVVGELERRGLWDATAPRRAVPLLCLSQVLAGIGGGAFVLALAVGEPRALLAIALLGLVAALAWGTARRYPRATPLGLAVARDGRT